MGQRVHTHITEVGSEKDNRFVGSTLVDMYAKCHSLPDAKRVFESLQGRDVVVWTALLGGYVECGDAEKALFCFEEMQRQGISPNCITYICTLKACAITSMRWGKPLDVLNFYSQMQTYGARPPDARTFVAILKECGVLQDLEMGQRVHTHITEVGSKDNRFVGSTLVDMYAKCHSLPDAKRVFESLQGRDVVVWTALLGGYVECGDAEKALFCFEEMQRQGISPNCITYICTLKACAITNKVYKALEIHMETEREGVLEKNLSLGNCLIDLYAKFGYFSKATEILERLPIRDVISWTALARGYLEYLCNEEALQCLDRMRECGVSANSVSLLCELQACGNMRALDKGRHIHAETERYGWLRKDGIVDNAFIDMYGKCGSLLDARQVFDMLLVKSKVSWSILITSYTYNGLADEAIHLFREMQLMGISLDTVMYTCCLKACGSIGALIEGQKVHADIARRGLLNAVAVGNAVLDMYGKCHAVSKAEEIFESFSVRNLVTWNALLHGYIEGGHPLKAIRHFEKMQLERIDADAVTFVGGLKSCRELGIIDKGIEIHVDIVRGGSFEGNLVVGNTLVDMYAGCGLVNRARQVFDMLPARNIITWNALMSGYVEYGSNEEVIDCLEQMRSDGIFPDVITYMCILKAFSNLAAT
ncbi:hypothetical protein KP509_26G046400 [Ceratopteris richardii]|nr:hypothetical protein KP509_26G046400 [Ceratopteris richardii]